MREQENQYEIYWGCKNDKKLNPPTPVSYAPLNLACFLP